MYCNYEHHIYYVLNVTISLPGNASYSCSLSPGNLIRNSAVKAVKCCH